ncbi:hypothetical protein SRB5_48690 [Streptomyces sp. RB5]|uniref:Lipoprotein n=1 Tax=Streptomyces smaragdinus TaxID=2585196 RepID=A0A7K0CN38_9ACTN|nr:hypothetical protein [Streptomyces smaragdinus]MQY14693.1 hypothetical protein [Streptomyces smaragdinus]
MNPTGRARRPRCAAALAAVLTTGALALGSAGCTGSSTAGAAGHPGGDPGTAVRDAADALRRSGSSGARTAMELTSGGTLVTVRGTGGFDYAKGRGRLRVVLPHAPDDPITELQTRGRLYMKNRGAGVPADKWLRLDTTRLTDGNLVSNGATDPYTAAELLRGARRVKYLGELDMDGVRVRHYRGVADLGRAARAASPYARGALRAAAEGFRQDTVAFDAYLDDQGRPRKVRHRFTLDSGRQTTVASTAEYFGFGRPVTVRLPDAPDIYAGTVAGS